MRIQKVSDIGKKFLAKEEGERLKAYLCAAKVWTISVGCTYYEDGTRVKKGDVITKERSDQLYTRILAGYEHHVDMVTRDDINQNQFDMLVSLCFNIGKNAFQNSTILRTVNKNPNDPKIAKHFESWKMVDGKPNEALLNRRKREATRYFLPVNQTL